MLLLFGRRSRDVDGARGARLGVHRCARAKCSCVERASDRASRRGSRRAGVCRDAMARDRVRWLTSLIPLSKARRGRGGGEASVFAANSSRLQSEDEYDLNNNDALDRDARARRGDRDERERRIRGARSHRDAGGASAVGDGLDAAVVEESTAVEHSLRDALFDAHGTEHLPDLLRRLHGLALPLLAPDDGLDGRAHRPERGDGFLVFVIDDLDVDVLVRSVHGNARAFGRSRNLSMETDDRIARQSLALVSPRVFARGRPSSLASSRLSIHRRTLDRILR